ncbi:putative carboxylesterase protein [Neofusicoccum parvum]|nr:putative carboxylesterase protein [Neofusicoccum parvum]
MASTATIAHPSLGTVRGKTADDGSGVTQFLGIKYASLKDRFAPPELVKGDPKGTVEAGEFGPHVVCIPGAVDMEFGFIQQTLPKPPTPPTSDLEGLNLNITVPPASAQKPAGGWPVLVFIHGGGLFIGANWWPQYDLKRYRLGLPGFLTSAEMQQAGYKANNGLRDQATALKWVKENIAGFGGDPENVTAMGESAGGASCLLQLQSDTPLFKRVISMAGTPIMMKPLPPAVAEHTYSAITAAFGLTSLSPADRISALRTLPIADLLSKAPPGLPLIFVADGDTVKETPSHASLAPSLGPSGSSPWCAELLAGWCGYDANILTHMVPALSAPNVAQLFTTSFSASLAAAGCAAGFAPKLFAAYAIDAAAPADAALPAVVELATDLLFRASARAYVGAWPDGAKAWLYDFELPNPWEGRWRGRPVHIMDVALLFLNFEEKLPDDGYRQAARGFAEEVLRFVAGGGARWDGRREVRVFGEGGARTVASEEEVRADRLAAVLEGEGVGLDVLGGAWAAFMQGK